jgi:hypothetical protein
MKIHIALFQNCANRYYTKFKNIPKFMAAYISAVTRRVGVLPVYISLVPNKREVYNSRKRPVFLSNLGCLTLSNLTAIRRGFPAYARVCRQFVVAFISKVENLKCNMNICPH